MRTFTIFLACCLGVLALNAQTSHLITTSGLNFVPSQLTIEVGDTVTWRNTGQGGHNVNGTTTTYPDNPVGFTNGSPSSAVWEFEFVFTAPGNYTYQCDPHAGANMIGFITVNDNTSGNVDLVITEIMYNPPEAGQDTYEYLEIYNNGGNAVNLLGYSLTGVDYTFTSGMNLGAGEYLVFAGDSIAFEAAFGFPALQWTNGSLSNSGELLKLFDDNGMVVDSVDYDDSFPWAAAADGPGASLVLCDFDSDNNDGTNWAAATTGTGFLSEGIEIFGNPGGASACPDGPIVRFLTDEIEVGEDAGTVTIGVEIRAADAMTYTVDVAADGASTATAGVDATFSPTTLTFSSGNAVDTLDVTVTITDDMDPESIEALILRLTNASNGLTIDGVGGSTTVLIADNDTDVAAIVINEIMYSPPGTDSQYEYLELYNNDAEAVNVGGYYFSLGIIDTLPDVNLLPGDFLLLAVDSVSFEAAYGLPAFQWISGALSNGGETIELRDPLGNVVDVVTYDNTGDWPSDANGSGSALVLCDPSSDNALASSWIAGVQPTGVFISGSEILGSPGAANDCTPPAPQGYTPYAIGEVTGEDATTGVADSLGTRAELTGIVYGGNLRPGGAQFTIIDAAGDGIATFSDEDDFGYTVTEGDEVTVQGVVSQFNGLTQLNLDTIIRNSSANTLLEPTPINTVTEDTESQLVRISGVTIVDFVTAGGGLNVNVEDGTNTTLVRIDFDTGITEEDIVNLQGLPLQITGLGGQFDSSQPYDEGYQLLPRYLEDIEVINATQEPVWAQTIALFPNPVVDQLTVRSGVVLTQLTLKSKLGQSLRTWKNDRPQTTIELAGLPAGIYFLELQAAGEQVVRKIIKQ